jgi:spore germination protein KC
MRIRLWRFIFVIVLTLSLTGCWDAIEISNHKIISLVGVDKIGDNVKFLLQYSTPTSNTVDNNNVMSGNAKLLTGEGKSFAEARESYLRRSANDIFIGSVRGLLFSDSLAKSGIEEYLNRLRGMGEYRRTITVFTTTKDIQRIFNARQSSAYDIGFDIEHLSQQLTTNGLLFNSMVSTILENICVPYTGYVISNLDVINEEISITGYSVFNNNKKIGLIHTDKMRGINYIILKKSRGDYVIELDGERASVSTLLKKRNIKAYYDGENIAFTIKLDLDLQILYLSENIKLDDQMLKELEEKVSEEIKNDIMEAIDTSQVEYECDYLYFYKVFRAKYNSEFKKMNWNEKYKDAEFDIEIKSKIVPGNLVNFK